MIQIKEILNNNLKKKGIKLAIGISMCISLLSFNSISEAAETDSIDTSNLESITVEATAYTRYDEGCGEYTATGKVIAYGIISVDPNIIPLGTTVYIPGYGYAVADDTGGAIHGYKVDLAMDSREDALSFGRQDITIYIVG